MTKAFIAKKISEEIPLNQKLSKKLVSSFFNIIKNETKSKNMVKISKFGTFLIHNSRKRLGRNPKTKESYIIEAREKIKFKASGVIKEMMN